MIIFLDFDGVLHPAQPNGEEFCRLRLLWKILRSCPNANVVFSTSWKEIHQFDELVGIVTGGLGGEDLAHRFIGATPSIMRESMTNKTGASRREQECRLWLSGNGQQNTPWIALDDSAVSFTVACQSLYLVDQETGLTEADALKIIERLKSK